MSEEKVNLIKELEENIPIYFTREQGYRCFFEDHRVIDVEVLISG